MTRATCFLAILALASACGGDDAKGEEAPPETPVFAGLESVAVVPGEVDQVELHWTRGTDDQTPPERIRYELAVRTNRDDLPTYHDVSEQLDGVFRWASLPQGNVYWFSIIATDEDENSSGADVVLPAVAPTEPPRITSISPARLEAGQLVTVMGEFLLDEPMLPDAVTIGGQAIAADQLRWSSRKVEFYVPRNLAGEGRVQVATPFGRSEAPEPLYIDPPGPAGQN